MAYLRKEDGKRILECIICKTEWEFLRLKCPHCETEDSRDLRFFQTDDESAYRVDVCDNCKSYMKTVNKREMDVVELGVVDIKTRYLDILAIKEGYKKSR